MELQEPTDLSVLLEWQRFGVDDGSETLGLGWDRVLESVDIAAMPELDSPTRADDLAHGIAELLPAAADPIFAHSASWSRASPSSSTSPTRSGGARGLASLWSDRADKLDLRSGDNALVPHGVGSTTLDGHATLIRCRPPSPGSGPGRVVTGRV